MKFLSILTIVFIPILVNAQFVQIHVKAENLQNEKLFLAGSFNGWSPDATPLKYNPFKKVWTVYIPVSKTNVEFKITKGSWETVEVNRDGSDVKNHVIAGNFRGDVHITIERFKSWPSAVKSSTAKGEIRIIENFPMPELKSKTTIRIYLPETYSKDTQKRFDVIYMHDGQNLFDKKTAAYGEWHVDETLQALTNGEKKFIVVGIDNTPNRLVVYNPYSNQRFGAGRGEHYLQFIIKTLKPFIDSSFRTNSANTSTTIAGSSMGGLISLYAVLKHGNVFANAGVFSPSLWIARPIFDLIKKEGKNFNGSIFLYAGTKESQGMIPDLNRAEQYLQKYSKFNRLKKLIGTSEGHNEAAWAKAFKEFVQWLQVN